MLRNILKAFILLILLGAIYIYIGLFSAYVFPWDKEEALNTTLEWGGLAPLPVPLRDMDIEKKGSPFTREFIIDFKTTENQLKDWIKNSKRLKNNIPKLQGSQKTYDIRPGEEGSFGGNVKIEGNTVTIKMSWS